jgi:hypothetical protein
MDITVGACMLCLSFVVGGGNTNSMRCILQNGLRGGLQLCAAAQDDEAHHEGGSGTTGGKDDETHHEGGLATLATVEGQDSERMDITVGA